MEDLSRFECLRLLGEGKVGRIGLSWDALPAIFPVNYVLDGNRIVIRTGYGSKLSAAMAGAVVAFEVDQWDAVSHTGWSVLVRGHARVLLDPAEVEEAKSLPLEPWANPDADHFVEIPCELVTGRRIRGWYED